MLSIPSTILFVFPWNTQLNVLTPPLFFNSKAYESKLEFHIWSWGSRSVKQLGFFNNFPFNFVVSLFGFVPEKEFYPLKFPFLISSLSDFHVQTVGCESRTESWASVGSTVRSDNGGKSFLFSSVTAATECDLFAKDQMEKRLHWRAVRYYPLSSSSKE